METSSTGVAFQWNACWRFWHGRCASLNTFICPEATTRQNSWIRCTVLKGRSRLNTTWRLMICSVNFSASCRFVMWSIKRWWWPTGVCLRMMESKLKIFRRSTEGASPQMMASCASYYGQIRKTKMEGRRQREESQFTSVQMLWLSSLRKMALVSKVFLIIIELLVRSHEV